MYQYWINLEVYFQSFMPTQKKDFRKGIDAFYLTVNVIELLSPGSHRLKPPEINKNFGSVVRNELDLRLKASAAFEYIGNTLLYIPKIYWETSCRRIITLDWVNGIPLDDLACKHGQSLYIYNAQWLSLKIFNLKLTFFYKDK